MKIPLIAVIGLGKMGEALVHHIRKTNHRLTIAIEVNLTRGKEVLSRAGIKYAVANNVEDARQISERGETILTDSIDLAFELDDVNVIIDATGNIDAGAYIAWKCINIKKNIVMLNAELDATIGPILSKIARSAGIIYTGDIGDEPGSIMYYLYRPLKEIGLEILVAGKGKNNPLNPHATPSSLKEMSEKLKLNPRILTSFVDGTKTMVEMTILSNATGLLPDVRGMHGPVADLKDLAKLFRTKNEGGILNNLHVVDYVIGIAPGVFVIATTDDEAIMENLRYLKVGDGPNFLFYRPYHLPGSETLLSAVKAVCENEAVIQPIGYFSETVAVAKRDLNSGERIDGIGGDTVYGIIERRTITSAEGLLPIGLSESATLKRSVRKDEVLTFDDVEIPDKLVHALWRLQQKSL
ncbi:MAG: SAF domain-containing protein [Nitrososphaerota archaeon]